MMFEVFDWTEPCRLGHLSRAFGFFIMERYRSGASEFRAHGLSEFPPDHLEID